VISAARPTEVGGQYEQSISRRELLKRGALTGAVISASDRKQCQPQRMDSCKQICKTFFDQPTFTLNGVQYDSQRLQSEAPRHTDAALPDNYPNGISGPPIDDKALQYVGSQGLCPEDAKPK
jgi:hypothetical protein